MHTLGDLAGQPNVVRTCTSLGARRTWPQDRGGRMGGGSQGRASCADQATRSRWRFCENSTNLAPRTKTGTEDIVGPALRADIPRPTGSIKGMQIG